MTSFLDSVEIQFGSKDLYSVLGIDKESQDGEIRRAYHRLSLKVHPDRAEAGDVEIATQKFQILGKIYSVLSDKDKRAIYDEDGTVDEEDGSVFEQNRDWMEYWRLLFHKITIGDIKKFEETYKGSEEERDTVKTVYLEKEGDMEAIMEQVLCASCEDEPRFRAMIEEWIAKEEVPSFPAFVSETEDSMKSRKRKYKEEAEEAEQALKELGADANGGDASLMALIKARQQSRGDKMDGFFSSLEEKYCTKKPKAETSSKGGASGSSKKGKGKGRKKGSK